MNHQFKEALGATRHHALKTDPDVYDAVASGAKTHEIRRNDRDFRVGDTLLLRKTRYTGQQMHMRELPLEYTGDECARVVSHVLEGYGLQDGWVILSFAAHEAVTAEGGAVQAEPVAYHVNHRGSAQIYGAATVPLLNLTDCIVTPLYAAPQPSPLEESPEDLRKAYALLFAENARLRAQVDAGAGLPAAAYEVCALHESKVGAKALYYSIAECRAFADKALEHGYTEITVTRLVSAQPSCGVVDKQKLWLWMNFTDGKPEYWAFDNPFPVFMDSDDPQTLGEPCGYAIVKQSRQGRVDVSEAGVLAAIQRATASKAQEAGGDTASCEDCFHCVTQGDREEAFCMLKSKVVFHVCDHFSDTRSEPAPLTAIHGSIAGDRVCEWRYNGYNSYASTCGRTLCSKQSGVTCQYCGVPVKYTMIGDAS